MKTAINLAALTLSLSFTVPLLSAEKLEHPTIEEAVRARCWNCLGAHLENLATQIKQRSPNELESLHESMSPFHLAAMNGNANLLKKLIREDGMFEPKKHSRDANGNTPMHLAARYGRKESLELLLAEDYMFEPIKNKKNNKGQTPLKLALIYGHEECALLLMDKGARE